MYDKLGETHNSLLCHLVLYIKRETCHLYDLPIEELSNVPTVCCSLREALESLQTDNDFLTSSSVFTNDQINAYIDLKMDEVINFEKVQNFSKVV